MTKIGVNSHNCQQKLNVSWWNVGLNKHA